MNHDRNVFYFILIGISVFLYFKLKKWLFQQQHAVFPFKKQTDIKKNAATQLLVNNGFEVISAKKNIPIQMQLDGVPYQSRYFIDYVVQKEDLWYIVKIEKQKKPFQWTGSSLRHDLYPFHLLYPSASGVILIDYHFEKMKVLTFKQD
jgi:hypothetical protein